MTLYHPTEPEHFKLRNELLQLSLRPDPLPFPIESEYPIVLAPSGGDFSYCQNFEDHLCAHANLWPRKVLNSSAQAILTIGLVGNVATDPRWRGHGHMRSLLTTMEDTARLHGLACLLLWSDLSSFYQKLGYQSLGKEFHFHFLEAQAAVKPRTAVRVSKANKANMNETQLQGLLDLRYLVKLTVQRSLKEFRSMLAIPWLELWLAFDGTTVVAYALIGKGYDMMGVIHEWGARQATYLLDLIQQMRRELALNQCMLLAPAQLDAVWHRELSEQAALVESVPMALVKILDPDLNIDALQELFIWGLDSI